VEKKEITKDELLILLEKRFDANPYRHRGMTWSQVMARLKANPKKINVLLQMERTEGEPDVVGIHTKTSAVIFMDCSQQSPKARRSVCYDQAAWDSRKEFKPKAGNAVSLAEAMGATLLDETQYLFLQSLQDIDTTTSSWILTPSDIRAKGGALFGDKRFGRAFIFHNGAESYYAERGFRTFIEI
jgi:hypothetical protein